MIVTHDNLPVQEIAFALERNSVEGCKAWAAWPRMEIHDEPEMVRGLTDVPFPFLNFVLRPRLAVDRADAAIRQICGWAGERGVPLSWWNGPFAEPADLELRLEAHGFREIGEVSGMAADLSRLQGDSGSPPDLEIAEVRDRETWQTWCEVMGSVNDFSGAATQAWCDMHAALGFGDDKPWRHFLGRLNGKPVATCSLCLAAGVAGIASVSTIKGARRMGIGSSISRHALLEARRTGFQMGVLWSSAMGESVYRKLGFDECCRARIFVWFGA